MPQTLTPTHVAKQAGHTTAVLHGTYEHLIDEYAEGRRIDVETEIVTARQSGVRKLFASADAGPGQLSLLNHETPIDTGVSEVPLPGFEPGLPP